MAKNCDACSDLQENSADFMQNGVTENVCNALKNDDGFNTASENDDCADLNNANDCLIGNMTDEIEAYEVCDWKAYTKSLVHNIWTVLKAMICSMCGLWTFVNKHECEINYLYNGKTFSFQEEMPGYDSKLVHGKGVDFSIRNAADEHSSDVHITYIAGGLCQIAGSLRTFTESFKDANGVTQQGNTVFDFSSNSFSLPNGGELLYEIRIKKSEFPQIKRLFNGHAFQTGGANKDFMAYVIHFDGDATSSSVPVVYAYGQHGWCNRNGTPSSSGYSSGHSVPAGWIYTQVRLYSALAMTTGTVEDGSGASKSGSNFSPAGYIGIRLNSDKAEC